MGHFSAINPILPGQLSAKINNDAADWTSYGLFQPSTTTCAITGIQDQTAYQCAVSYRKGPGTGSRLILGPVTAGQTSVPYATGITGPKPPINATDGAPSGSPVGTYPDADQVYDEINFNANSLANTILAGNSLQVLVAARTLINGQSVNTVIQQVQDQVTTSNTATANTLSLLGASVNGGTAFQLNADSVYTDDGQSLSTRLTTTEATLGSQQGQIDTLNSVVIDPTGATLRSVLQLDVNGNISGTISTNNGKQSTFAVLANVFQITDPNSGKPYTPFVYTNGTIYMTNVVVDTLKVNTAIVPVRAAASASVTGSAGSGSTPSASTATQNILSMPIVMPVEGWIQVIGTLHQGFATGSSQQYASKIQIDGADVPESVCYGTVPGDNVTMAGSLLVGAGTHTVTMLWNASSSITALNRSLFASGYPNTA